MFVFSNGVETVENDSLTLDPDVSARLTSRGSLRIVERDASGTERVIFDASASKAPQASAPVNGATSPTLDTSAPVNGAAKVDAVPSAPITAVSDFGNGKQIHDPQAAERIAAQEAILRTLGVNLDRKEQLFATGTRMAKEGYSTQAARKQEHDASSFLVQAAGELRQRVIGENRTDYEISAGEFGRDISVNGKITVRGLQITEQAIRGLLARIDSPALSYVLGLRERIAIMHAAEIGKRDEAGIKADRAKVAEVLSHECKRNPDVKLKMRARHGIGDVFAIVSPSYVAADAPAVLDNVIAKMPRDAKGSYAYDPKSTTWELRADVWTPTPVEKQAVGEPFRGYVSFQSKDNGTGRFRGGGGIELIRCLNASTYLADGAHVSRRHMGRILYDIDRMIREATKSVHALCAAWGTSRETIVETPKGVSVSEALPGFYRYLLKQDRDLVNVLPGRKEEHVKGLVVAFNAERRDSSKLVRSDFAQGWTRYIQRQSGDVRREAEAAIGAWVVNGRDVGFDSGE